MKKIISLISAIALAITAMSSFALIASAAEEPTLSCSVAYPVEMYGSQYVEVTVKASNFDYTAYNAFSKDYAGVTGIQFELSYDSSVLTYVTGLAGSITEPQIGSTAPKYAVGKGVEYVIDAADIEVVKYYFTLNSNFDVNTQSTAIDFVEDSVLVQYERKSSETIKYGDHPEATTDLLTSGCTLGTADDGTRVVATTNTMDISDCTHPYVKVDLTRTVENNETIVESNNFWLPEINGVIGGKSYIRPILKYTIDNTNKNEPNTNDVFKLKLYDWNNGPVEKDASASITVE